MNEKSMSAKHTPGPWSINYDCEYAKHGQFSIETNDFFIALVDAGLIAQQANARLIAAAPELLLVTQGFRRKLATYVSVYPGDKELRRLLDECDAAITKAIG